MKLSQQTQGVIGRALVHWRDYCKKELDDTPRVFSGTEAEEHAAFWRGLYEKACAAFDEWIKRDHAEK